MGWNTYHQIVTELSPEMWVYDNLITYVFTHKYYENGAKIKFTNDDAKDFIDRYRMTIIPTILRKEIRLFETTHDYEIKLKLIKSLSYNGISDCFMNEDNILL